MQLSNLEIEEIKNSISLKDMNFPIDESNDVFTFLFGNTGSGKSTLVSLLAGLQVMVRDSPISQDAILECKEYENAHSEGLSFTRGPNILFDSNNKIIYADWPSLEDCAGPKQDIINSFYIHYLLDSITKNNHKIKILFVISSDEIFSFRGKSVRHLFERIEKIFPNVEQLQKATGIVITKSDPEHKKTDYISYLKYNSSEAFKKWCNFLKENQNKIFTLPKASEMMVDTVFQYEEKNKLISFLKDNPIDSIQHEILFDSK